MLIIALTLEDSEHDSCHSLHNISSCILTCYACGQEHLETKFIYDKVCPYQYHIPVQETILPWLHKRMWNTVQSPQRRASCQHGPRRTPTTTVQSQVSYFQIVVTALMCLTYLKLSHACDAMSFSTPTSPSQTLNVARKTSSLHILLTKISSCEPTLKQLFSFQECTSVCVGEINNYLSITPSL